MSHMKNSPSKKSGKKTAQKHNKNNRTVDTVGIPVASVFGCAVGLASATGLTLICSLICLFSSNPDRLISPLAYISAAVVFLISGFAASKKKRAAIPCGLMAGGILTVIFFAVSLCLDSSLSSNLSLPLSLLLRAGFIALSVIGALLGVNTGIKKRRR